MMVPSSPNYERREPGQGDERPAETNVRRHLVGICGLIALAVGIYFYLNPPTTGSLEFLHGSCIKSGIVLLLMWLALPQLDKMPIWMFGGLLLLLLSVAIRPRIVLAAARYSVIFIPIAVMIWLLRPKQKRRNR